VIVPHRAEHLTTLAVAVEDAANRVVLAQKGVGLVDQQRWPIFLDHAEDCCGRDIGGRQRSQHEAAEHVEQQGFATPLGRRAHAESRRN
jgi:hypothetical protein